MEKVINKSEVISNVSARCEFLADDIIDKSVREVIDLMIQALVEDGRIEVRGFGSFCLHHRDARVGRNPKTGENITIPAKAIPHFKPGKALREAVNDWQ